MDFSLRQIGHFLAVIDHLSFRGAADRLNMTQPALSKSIKAMEDRMGARLFQRQPRGVVPTPQGRVLEGYARRIQADAERARAEMADLATGAPGRVVVGIGTPYLGVLERSLPSFRDRFPTAALEFSTGFAGHLGRLLAANQLDFVLAMYNGLQQQDRSDTFSYEHWRSDGFVGICPAGHPLHDRTCDPAEIAGHDWAMLLIDQSAVQALNHRFAEGGARFPAVRITTDSIRLVRHAVARQGMISLVPACLLEDPAFDRIGTFRIRGFDFARKIGLIRRRDFDLSPRHRYLADLLRDGLTGVRDD